MVNTNSASDNSPTTLELYSFNGKQLIDKFHDQMVNYLKNNSDTSNGFFKNTLAISHDFNNLQIGDWDSNSIGFKSANVIKQGNRSVSEFATYILQLYISYLQQKEEEQAKMDFFQIGALLDYDGQPAAMFSANAYVDWIVNNMNKQHDGYDISIDYIDDSHAIIYLLKRLVIALNQANTIDSFAISTIVEHLVEKYQFMKKKHLKLPLELLMLSNQLSFFTKNFTILHQKFTNLAEMNYDSLFKLFKLTDMTVVTLPLISIFNIGSDKSFYEDIDIKFYVTNREELEYFINIFITDRKWNYMSFKDIIKHKIIFYFKDYQNVINSQINTIGNNFSHIKALANVSDILSFILKESLYK